MAKAKKIIGLSLIAFLCTVTLLNMLYFMYKAQWYLDWEYSYKDEVKEQIMPIQQKVDSLEKRINSLENKSGE